jgi:hypothetical protein
MKSTIAIDFDGVLADYNGWKGEANMGPPRPGVREFLEALQSLGEEVVVFSTRPEHLIEAWLQRFGFSPLVAKVTNVKPRARVYLDDRAVTFKGDFHDAFDRIGTFRAYWEK